MPEWLRQLFEGGQRVIAAPGRMEREVAQTSTALQHTLDQLLFWAEVAVAVLVITSLARAAFALYNWNLRRREVLAEERQALAEQAQAVALKAILEELRRINPAGGSFGK